MRCRLDACEMRNVCNVCVGILFLISLNTKLFNNIAHARSLLHFVVVYLCICISVFLYLTYGNIIFDILES